MRGFIQLNAWGTSADKNRRQSTGKGKAMADISLEAVAGKLNRVGYEAFFKALRQAKGAGNRNVELAHWLAHINGVMQHHRPGGPGQQYQRNRYPQWGKADSGC